MMSDIFLWGLVFILIISSVLFGFILSMYIGETESPNVYEIYTCQDLYDVRNDLNGIYFLMNDLDCKDYRYE